MPVQIGQTMSKCSGRAAHKMMMKKTVANKLPAFIQQVRTAEESPHDALTLVTPLDKRINTETMQISYEITTAKNYTTSISLVCYIIEFFESSRVGC